MKTGLKVFLIVIAVFAVLGTVWHFAVADVTFRNEKAVSVFYDVYGKNPPVDAEQKTAELVSGLGNCERYALTTRRRIVLFFVSYGMTLVGEYDAETYAAQKQFIENNYTFVSEKNAGTFKYELDSRCAYEFDMDGWHFRLLKEYDDKTDLVYYYIPETFRMVAFNDAEHKIAFLTYGDQDQDCFGENNDEADLAAFVKEQFAYKF